jgi:hypothetical protein
MEGICHLKDFLHVHNLPQTVQSIYLRQEPGARLRISAPEVSVIINRVSKGGALFNKSIYREIQVQDALRGEAKRLKTV